MHLSKKLGYTSLLLLTVTGCQTAMTPTGPAVTNVSENKISDKSYALTLHGNEKTRYAYLVSDFEDRAWDLCKSKPFKAHIDKEVNTVASESGGTKKIPYIVGKINCRS